MSHQAHKLTGLQYALLGGICGLILVAPLIYVLFH
jgi:hypothetical protein